MARNLQDLTLEELWQLFPIVLEPHNPERKVWYEDDNAEVAFAEYLRQHPDVAKEYEALKLSLWHKYEHDRDSYTEAKTEFITKYQQ